MDTPINLGAKSYSKVSVVVFLFITALVYFSHYYNFLFFHSLAEILTLVIMGAIFVIIWDSKDFIKNYFLLFIGIAIFFIGWIDTLHTLTYKGMNVFPGFNANLPTQLWIAARYLQAVSLLIALIFLRRKYRPGLVFIIFSLITGLLLLSIFYWQVFPVCYIEGVGLTVFKKVSEYIISILFIVFWGLLFYKRKYFSKEVFGWLSTFVFASIISESAFTFYVGVYDLSNLIGHIFKILAFYALYVAIVQNTILFPFYSLIYSLDMKKKELEDVNKKLIVSERKTKQNLAYLEKTNKFMVGRELKMKELKNRIKSLENENKK